MGGGRENPFVVFFMQFHLLIFFFFFFFVLVSRINADSQSMVCFRIDASLVLFARSFRSLYRLFLKVEEEEEQKDPATGVVDENEEERAEEEDVVDDDVVDWVENVSLEDDV